jgi:hypothetical protein
MWYLYQIHSHIIRFRVPLHVTHIYIIAIIATSIAMSYINAILYCQYYIVTVTTLTSSYTHNHTHLRTVVLMRGK